MMLNAILHTGNGIPNAKVILEGSGVTVTSGLKIVCGKWEWKRVLRKESEDELPVLYQTVDMTCIAVPTNNVQLISYLTYWAQSVILSSQRENLKIRFRRYKLLNYITPHYYILVM